MTAAEKRHLDAVASLGCLITGGPAEIHHVRRYGEKRNHFKTAPLSYEYHRGSEGIHTLGKKEWERRYMTQDDLLRKTAERLKEAM